MEGFVETMPLNAGPLYFFDQLQPERKKWRKETCEDQFSHLLAHYNKENPEGLKQAKVNTAASCEKYEFCLAGLSEPPSLLRLPSSLKPSKLHVQNCLFEEYKRIAPETLGELEEMLQRYAGHHAPFPMGLVNLVNYSWQELTDSIPKPCPPRAPDPARQGQPAVKAKQEDSVSASKFVKKLSLASHDHGVHPESSSPDVIHFSLSSKACLENGWVFQRPYSPWEILEWRSVLQAAVQRLQESLAHRKTEEAKLKSEGLDRAPILRYYREPEGEEEKGCPPPRSFWLRLLERRPQLLTALAAKPERRTFYCALADGSSSPSERPGGGTYTNIFSDGSQGVLGTFTPSGCGSISSPRQILSVVFNQDGGMAISKSGQVIREWTWPAKGLLEDPMEIGVNRFITVRISGRFAITLAYRCHPQSLKLSLAPKKHKPTAPHPPGEPAGSVAPGGTDISRLQDAVTTVELGRLQSRARCLLLGWQDHCRRALGLDPLPVRNAPLPPVRAARIRLALPERALLAPETWGRRGALEGLRRWDTVCAPRAPKPPPTPLPLPRQPRRTQARPRGPRPLPVGSRDAWFTSQLLCPVVLRRTLQGQRGHICRCSTRRVPEVTDLEYDRLIHGQLCATGQTVIVHVISAEDPGPSGSGLAQVYREQNRSRTMPCVQSHLDPFRLLRYDVTSASRSTGGERPLLVRRHNIVPGIFLMYIRGKLLFVNFIFNGYSTSARDLQKQIVKTRDDYLMGYFLPSDFRIRLSRPNLLPPGGVRTEDVVQRRVNIRCRRQEQVCG